MNRLNKRAQTGEALTSYFILIPLFVIMGIFVVFSYGLYTTYPNPPAIASTGGNSGFLFEKVKVNWDSAKAEGLSVGAKSGEEEKMIIDYLFDSANYDEMGPVFAQALRDAPVGTCAYIISREVVDGKGGAAGKLGLLAKKIEVRSPGDNPLSFNSGEGQDYQSSNIPGEVFLTRNGEMKNIKYYYGKCLEFSK